VHWDPSVAVRKLPASLYLPSKPAFFGSLPWPPIGPDRTPMAGTIPARERFLKRPPQERLAQNRLYLGEYLLAEGRKDEAFAALRQVVEQHPDSAFAPTARKLLKSAR
jgi:hypothetical protein